MPKKQIPRRPHFQQKQSFDWQQSHSHLVVLIPCGILQQRDLNIEISDLCVRISNQKKPSQTYVLDLLHEIDITSLKNKAVVRPGDQIIELVLQKKEQDQQWDDLEFIAQSRDQLIQRRNQAFDRLRAYEEQQSQKAKEAQIKLDKSSVEEQMRVEGEQRDLLKRRQEEEKKQAEDEMYDLLEQKYQSKPSVNEIQDDTKVQEKESESTEVTSLPPPRPVIRNELRAGDIFSTHDIKTEQTAAELSEDRAEELLNPVEVRRKHKQELKFSEKKYPHMPTRESHLKQPPYPKSKNYQPTKQDMMIDIEERNPVWLKDKGDHFFEKNDFKAAINAYTKAIQNDKDFLKAYLNRATCLLLIRRPQEAIKDCEKIDDAIKQLKDSEKEDPFYKKVRLRATVKRAAAKAWLSMFEEAILDYKDALAQISASRRAYRPLESIQEEYDEEGGETVKTSALVEKKDEKVEEMQLKMDKQRREKMMKLQEKMRKEEADLVSDHQISQIETDIELVTRRMESQLEKEVGDAAFAEQDYNRALQAYGRAVQIDPTNEYAFGNIALVHLKQLNYAECIDYCNKALSLIEQYMPHTKPFSVDNRLEVKLRLRRGLCFEKHDNYQRAKEDLDRCVQQEPYNTEARGLLKRVQEKLNNKLFEKYRAEGVALQNEAKQLTAAMQRYDKCLQIIERKVTRIEHVSVYASKASCLLGLQKYQESLSYTNDALRLLKNLTMRPGKKEKNEHDKSREMEFKILLVKSQALSKLARDVEASESLDLALKQATTDRERKLVQNLKKKL